LTNKHARKKNKYRVEKTAIRHRPGAKGVGDKALEKKEDRESKVAANEDRETGG